MKDLKQLTKVFAERITRNSHFEHIGKNVHRVIEIETAINAFNEMVGEKAKEGREG